MHSKRALVVDDSKSARAFLSRILERHEITVDAAESAEAAIDYLSRTRPDVIFMDHMMPGMDGFQAVQSIKNNPRTSSIPILMYTSQEGDLYLGQARALGAEGVLPKQIKQSDVTKMLYQLRLVSDRRGEEQSTFTRLAAAPRHAAANESAINLTALAAPPETPIVVQPPAVTVPIVMPVPVAESGTAASESAADVSKLLPQLSFEIRAALDQTLKSELASLRGFLGTALDTHTERLHGEIVGLAPPPPAAGLDLPTFIRPRPWGAITGWTFALLATAGAAWMSWQWWQQGAEVAALRTDLSAAYAEVEALRARPPVVSLPPAPAVDPATVDPAAAASVDGALSADVATATPGTIAPAPGVTATATAATSAPVTAAAPASAPSPTPASPPPSTQAQ